MAGAMMTPGPSAHIWTAAGHTEMRRGMQGLNALVQIALERNTFSGHVFVFRGLRGDLNKNLWFDGVGLRLFLKTLERGYEYLRSGALSVMRLPTGRTLTYSFDDAGRPVGVGDGATAYVSSVGYTDFGAMSSLRMNGWLLRETRSYDSSRLQDEYAPARCREGAPDPVCG